MLPCRLALALFAGLLLAPAAYAAGTPAQHCRQVGTDDAPRPVPASLVPTAKRALGLRAPNDVVRRTTLFRCAEGVVLVCTVGANLNCGKASTAESLAPARRYCRENPDATFIPAYVTGHDAIRLWRCRGVDAVAGEPAEALDGRGFVARLWKPVE